MDIPLHKVEPQEAVLLWGGHFWDDAKFKEWIIVRSCVHEAKADEIIAHMKKEREKIANG